MSANIYNVLNKTYIYEKEGALSMASISPVRHVDAIKIEENEQGLKVQYCIWEGCVEAKWMEIEGFYLVNPNFIKLFKQRHKLC